MAYSATRVPIHVVMAEVILVIVLRLSGVHAIVAETVEVIPDLRRGLSDLSSKVEVGAFYAGFCWCLPGVSLKTTQDLVYACLVDAVVDQVDFPFRE